MGDPYGPLAMDRRPLQHLEKLAAGLLLNASALARHTIEMNGTIEDGCVSPFLMRMVKADSMRPLVLMADTVLSNAHHDDRLNVNG